jgi:hypothetical protein
MSNDFNTNKNIELLWEVLLDETHVKSMSDMERKKLYELFNNHRKIFYEKEKESTSSLVIMNKKFLSFFIQFVNSKIKDNSQLQNSTMNSSINSNVYKKEDIQIQKQNKFQKDLAAKKMDFENTMNHNKPPELDFSEKIEETKIKGMDELIAKTIEQRNYEISQIHNNSYNNSDLIPEQWLKTSLKKDNNPIVNNQNTTFKQIKIEDLIPIDHEVINLPNEKKITWNDSNEIKYFYKNDILMNENQINSNNEINTNILHKLKKIEPIMNINIDVKTEILQIKNEMIQFFKKVNGLEKQIETIHNTLNKINLMLNNINI